MIKKILKTLFKILIIFLGLILLVLLLFGMRGLFHENTRYNLQAPDTGYYIDGSDSSIYIQEYGPKDGPAILFIHGTASWSEIWKESLIHFGDLGYRAIAMDLAPFGYSEKPQDHDYSLDKQSDRIISVVTALGLDSVTLIGHSFGAKPTLEAAFNMPDTMKGLVIIDGALGLGVPAAEASTLFNIINYFPAVRNTLMYSTVTNPLFSTKILQSLIYDPADATREIITEMQRPTNIKETTHSLGEWLYFLLYEPKNNLSDNIENYKNIPYPVGIIWGEKDTITPLVQGEYLDKIIPNSHLNILENVGHIPHIEDIKSFNKALNQELDIIYEDL